MDGAGWRFPIRQQLDQPAGGDVFGHFPDRFEYDAGAAQYRRMRGIPGAHVNGPADIQGLDLAVLREGPGSDRRVAEYDAGMMQEIFRAAGRVMAGEISRRGAEHPAVCSDDGTNVVDPR